MKFAVAALLGLASVNAGAFGNINSIFDDSTNYVVGSSTSTFSVTQTLDWDVDYGTYFENGVGSDATGDYISQYYGTFAESYVSAEYVIMYGASFSLDVLFEFQPFYYVPFELQCDIYRWINNGIAPEYYFYYNDYYYLAYFITEWTEQVGVTDTSVTDYLINGNGNIYPDQSSWALSDTDSVVDPIYTGSVFDWINNALGDPMSFSGTYAGTYGSYDLTL